METITPAYRFSLRPATEADAQEIHRIIYQMKLNPMSLDWHHFVLAVAQSGGIIGCGQVKPHFDGTYELASIAVLPEWRGQGVARAIIEYLLEQHPGTLHLTCRSELGPMYEKFGFKVVDHAELTPYFKRISRFVSVVNKLTNQPDILLVMRR